MRKEEFLSPKTTRVYLQAPYSERLVMLFPDFKAVDLELDPAGRHTDQGGSGFLLLHGEEQRGFDARDVSFEPVTGGLPVYAMHTREECDIRMEAFAGSERIPRTYARVTVSNPSEEAVGGSLGILPRSSAHERYLTGLVTTGYNVYASNDRTWYMVRSMWEPAGPGLFSDGTAFLRVQGVPDAVWMSRRDHRNDHEASDYCRISYTLAPGESRSFELCFTTGEIPGTFDYDRERAAACARWSALLGEVRIRPDTDDPYVQSLFSHLCVQCLQMLAKYRGSDLVTPRQGDVGRYVWPWEAANMLIPMDRVGLSSRTGDPYRYFLATWFTREGEDRGKIMSNHQQWGNLNGSLIWGICEHLRITRSAPEFAEFRPYLFACMDWILKERDRSAEVPGAVKGIFPPGKGTDWNEIAQHWCFTDAQNVKGLSSMADVCEAFGDPDAGRVRAAYEEYRDTLLRIADELYAGHENDESFLFPHDLGPAFEDTMQYCYYICGAPYLFQMGILPYTDRRFTQMENWFREHGLFERGLCGRMTNCSDANPGLYGDVYYTVNGEMIWLEAWKARREPAKAAETLQALYRWCVTPEMIVSERYCSREPWYSPWQPNASSSGRMISILLDHYGERPACPGQL